MLLQCFGATREDVRFTPGKKSLVTQWINGRMSPRVAGPSFLAIFLLHFAYIACFVFFNLFQILETEKVWFLHPEEKWVIHYITQNNEMQNFLN